MDLHKDWLTVGKIYREGHLWMAQDSFHNWTALIAIDLIYIFQVGEDICISDNIWHCVKINPNDLITFFEATNTTFANNWMWINVMSIQYVAPGFEHTTSQTWVVSHNH